MLDLLSRVKPLVEAFGKLLIPGWAINTELLPAEKMEGALAWCLPTPTRNMASIRVLSPWPESESLPETIAHELTHALLSPLTALIQQTEASVMLEEQAVERLGIALAQVPLGVARAMVKAVDRYAPRIRARLSAPAPHGRQKRRNGGSVDIKMFLAALRAALTAEDPKAAIEALLKEVEVSGGDGGTTDPPPPAREDGNGPPPENTGAAGREDGKPEGMARASARLVSAEVARARKAADSATGTAIRSRIKELRGDGIVFDTDFDKELNAMTDLDAFERRVADVMRGRTMANPNTQRAHSGQKPNTTPAGGGTGAPASVDAATLAAEGFGASFITHYNEEHAANPEAAKHTLEAARRARANPNAAAPWQKKGG